MEIAPTPEEAARITQQIVDRLGPTYLLLVGLGTALRRLAIGDVLVPEKVYGFEFGAQAGDFKPHPEVAPPSHRLHQRARQVARRGAWADILDDTNGRRPIAAVEPAAAGAVSIASLEAPALEILSRHYGDAIAVHHEGLAFLGTALRNKADAMAILGLSCVSAMMHANAANEKQAAESASAFATTLLIQQHGSDHAEPALSRASEPAYDNDDERKWSEELSNLYLARNAAMQRGDLPDAALEGKITNLRQRLYSGSGPRRGQLLADGSIRLDREVGSGNYGTVWEATLSERPIQSLPVRPPRRVAVKILHGHLRNNQEARERFVNGALHMDRVRHTAVVRVVKEPSREDGYVWYAMEFLDGRLREAMRDPQLHLRQRMNIVLDVGEALVDAHALKIYHRDLKPDNILLDTALRGHLTDFDLVHAEGTIVRTMGPVGGTLVYSAPEQVFDEAPASPLMDVYSLGMTAIAILLGSDPTFEEVIRDRVRLIRGLRVGPTLKAALLRATARDPRDRQRSMQDLCAEIAQALEEEDVRQVVEDVSVAEEPDEDHNLLNAVQFLDGLQIDLLLTKHPRLQEDLPPPSAPTWFRAVQIAEVGRRHGKKREIEQQVAVIIKQGVSMPRPSVSGDMLITVDWMDLYCWLRLLDDKDWAHVVARLPWKIREMLPGGTSSRHNVVTSLFQVLSSHYGSLRPIARAVHAAGIQAKPSELRAASTSVVSLGGEAQASWLWDVLEVAAIRWPMTASEAAFADAIAKRDLRAVDSLSRAVLRDMLSPEAAATSDATETLVRVVSLARQIAGVHRAKSWITATQNDAPVQRLNTLRRLMEALLTLPAAIFGQLSATISHPSGLPSRVGRVDLALAVLRRAMDLEVDIATMLDRLAPGHLEQATADADADAVGSTADPVWKTNKFLDIQEAYELIWLLLPASNLTLTLAQTHEHFQQSAETAALLVAAKCWAVSRRLRRFKQILRDHPAVAQQIAGVIRVLPVRWEDSDPGRIGKIGDALVACTVSGTLAEVLPEEYAPWPWASSSERAFLFTSFLVDTPGAGPLLLAFSGSASARIPPAPPPTQPATGRWPIFLAYARADLADAKRLGTLLRGEVDTFLALDSIELGEDWDRVIPKAQRAAQISVVLSSKATDRAYYQRDEVAAAIDLARKDDTAHRVIPVWLDGPPGENVPYGLRLKQGLDVVEAGGLPGVAERILQLARKMGLTRGNTALVRRLRKLGWDDHGALNAALNQGFPDDAAAYPLLDALKAQGVSAPLRTDPATRWLTLLAAAETRAPEGTTAVAKAAFLVQPDWTGGRSFLQANEVEPRIVDLESLIDQAGAQPPPADQPAATDSNTTQRPTGRKILFLAANPLTTSRLALDQEFRSIGERLQMSAQRDRFTLTSAWAVRTGDLRQQLLDQKPDIVHFAGHGTTDGLVLEGRTGGAQRASGAALTALFGLFKDHVRCVVLNACWSDEQANAIATEIPVVIGMAGPVIDDAGVLFADGLYQGLGAGRSVEDAVQLGRVAYELEELGASAEPKIRVKSGIDLKTWRL